MANKFVFDAKGGVEDGQTAGRRFKKKTKKVNNFFIIWAADLDFRFFWPFLANLPVNLED